MKQFLNVKDLFIPIQKLYQLNKFYNSKKVEYFSVKTQIYFGMMKKLIEACYLNQYWVRVYLKIYLLQMKNHKSQYLIQYFAKKFNLNTKIHGYFHTTFPNSHLSLKHFNF